MYLHVAVNIHIYQLLEYATPDENIEERKSSSGAAYDNTLGLVFSEDGAAPESGSAPASEQEDSGCI